jgi:hypothetical protein
VHRSRDERAWWRQAGIDPLKVARRLWKKTHGMGQRPQPSLRRHRDEAASSDPKNEDISATATTQEEPAGYSRLAGPEQPDARGRDDVET